MSAHEQYTIGDFKLFADKRLLVTCDKEIKIDGKQTAILLFFARNPNQLITREQLTENVWQGRYVSDHAINTKISELRKLLQDDYRNPKYLKTHHQRGYELIAPCSMIEQLCSIELKDTDDDIATTDKLATLPKSKRGTKITVLFASIFCLLLIGYFLLNSTLKESPPALTSGYQSYLPVTIERGQEWAPAPSPNGDFLAYNHRNNNLEPWQLRIKKLGSNEVFPLTSGLFESHSPVWIKGNSAVAYTKSIEGKCEIWSTEFEFDSREKNSNYLTDCGTAENLAPLAISNDKEWLYFSNVKSAYNSNIERFNLLTNISEKLTTTVDHKNDFSFSLSKDNTKLAFLRKTLSNQVHLYVLDIDTKDKRLLKTYFHTPTYLSWSNDNNKVYIINQNNSLSEVDVRNKETDIVKYFQSPTRFPVLTQTDDFYLVDGAFFSSEIISAPISNDLYFPTFEQRIYSSYKDVAPAISNDSQFIAFTSNRSGFDQIWLKTASKQYSLTNFKQVGTISDKSFSPDNHHLLFIRNNSLHLIDINQPKADSKVILDQTFNEVRSPIWSCDGQSILLSLKDDANNWALYRYNVAASKLDKLLTNIITIKSACSINKYFTLQLGKPTLIERSGDFKQSNPTNLIVNSIKTNNWQIDAEYLYLLSDNLVTKTKIDTGEEAEIFLPLARYYDFVIHKKLIYASKKIPQETKIKHLIRKQ
ncbi:winged helix-turn-helix domain-containing protein [Psychrobium sp. 1_MG-2023]|uniref:winged helix-turn-helix domain-containing protein n=1 Tax=Psychrobium sp. 1_MG-2023 TaxID=3062624 RepID=UPI000C333538|nr:winged helix-turn-helix domain-containing protein [Psychrobium sp. 1_MG-2023]MDP2560969.1 winged helix-turn-helix domain-containing protein [Psychrobium sp. 1_MG-2023]PKF54946.1 hypothetical protein CW748_14850 [Alteromonadales bacterium alter-6D02]